MKCGSEEERIVLSWFASQASKVTCASKILLFGSRARGDAGDRSDFDFAIDTPFPQKIAELRAILEDNPYTLLSFDVVDLNSVSPEFRKRIISESKPIV
ncbi:MAG: nucleotidyltransferase domain-containing protein [Pseudomonadota bacterium]